MELEVGKTYDVDHNRKGKFRVRVVHLDEDWLDGEIVKGRASYMTSADAMVGDVITIKRSLASFQEVK